MTARPSPALLIALSGAACMAALAFGLWLPPAYPYIGAQLYDFYAAALIDGRFDLPLRELRLEGHYTADGTGYLYHGLGPLLTRLPFLPFVDLPTRWLSPLTIWLWSVAGNAAWHRAFALALDRARAAGTLVPGFTPVLLALAIWFGAPGLFLVGNGAIFSEPVAMAYGLGGGFMLIVALVGFGRWSVERALLPLAVLAGLTVHARPHLAVGYYAGVCLLAAVAAWRGSRRARVLAGGAMLVLALFGGILLASNALRFRSATVMHGSFGSGEVQYGMVYWGAEPADGWRARGFTRYGQFNPLRVLPNAVVYVLSPTYDEWSRETVDALEGFNHSFAPAMGQVRIEKPRGGTLFLWPAATLLMLVGLFQRPLWRLPALAGLAAAGIGAVLLLSYATITLRYHADLWPLVALPALFGIDPLLRWLAAPGGSRTLASGGVVVLAACGVLVTGLVVLRSRQFLMEEAGTLSARWSDAHCMTMTARKGFAEARGRELCGLAPKETRR